MVLRHFFYCLAYFVSGRLTGCFTLVKMKILAVRQWGILPLSLMMKNIHQASRPDKAPVCHHIGTGL